MNNSFNNNASSSNTSSNMHFDYENKLMEALVNEGKYHTVLLSRRPSISYDEKSLREAAAAEVAKQVANSSNSTQNNNNSNNNVNMAGDDETGHTLELSETGRPKKRRYLSADEKVKQSRDRNREHAKNTRLRKKAYVSKLKSLVDQLTQIKDVEARERVILGRCVYDTHNLRKNAVFLFLNYRATNIMNRQKWLSLVDENIVVTVPITPYRWFSKTDIVNNSRILAGIDALIRDNASQAFMAREFGRGTDAWKAAVIARHSASLIYDINVDDLVAASDLVMGCYQLILDGTGVFRDHALCSQTGMIQVKFNQENKIIAVELVYDVMGFMQQLQRETPRAPEDTIIPNTLAMALQTSNTPRMIVKLFSSNEVVHINRAWTEMKGITQSMIENLTISQALLACEFQCTTNNGRETTTMISSKDMTNHLDDQEQQLPLSSSLLSSSFAVASSSNFSHEITVTQLLENMLAETQEGFPVHHVIHCFTPSTSTDGGIGERGFGEAREGSNVFEYNVSNNNKVMNHVTILPLVGDDGIISHALISTINLDFNETYST